MAQTTNPRIARALISVSDKSGLVPFAQALAARGVQILSTGGSAKALRDAGAAVTEVADHTGFPEMLDGRAKTLHPKIHGGILGIRGNPEHEAAMAAHGIPPIDLVVVNLYPFEETVAKGADFDTCVENIDIGGPSMIRAAAKNHAAVTVVVDPADYDRVLAEINAHDGATTADFRRELAHKAFARTGAYDAAFELVAEFAEPAVAIVKHANPCGVAAGPDLMAAYRLALRRDPVSAFGGIVALNRPLSGDLAEDIAKIFTEVVIAPEADEAALKVFSAKKNLRLLLTGGMPDPAASGWFAKTLSGGILMQSRDNGRISAADVKVVTKRAPTEREMRDLLFAFTVGKHVKSNAIVYVKDGATVGIGAGQMSRVDSSRIAARKAEDAAREAGLPESLARGSVVASDAFFPFADGLLAAAEAGATAVIQPGGRSATPR